MATTLWIFILVFCGLLLVVVGLESLRRQKHSFLSERLGVIDRQSLIDGAADDTTGMQSRMQRVGKRFVPKQILDDTAKRIRWAGLSMQAEQFYGISLTSAIVVTGLVLALSVVGMGSGGLILTLGSAGAGYFLPDIWLKSKVAQRHAQVEKQLISFIDMMTVAVESGLNLGDALRQVSEKMGGLLGAEFGLAARNQKMGATLTESLQGVHERIGHDDLGNVIANICEALRMGTPIVGMMRDQANGLRAMRQLRANELAQKMAVKILLPVMLCIFGPMMVIILGPAMMNLTKAMGN